jgi:RNA-directed DNA polymerase
MSLMPMLIRETGLSQLDIQIILHNAPSRYKRFTIPKRNGERRPIAQPARELKALQRALITGVLSHLPVHPSAKAYRKGVSIADNAAAHAGNGPILKYDFQNFFPSITSRDWAAYCNHHQFLQEEDDQWISERILFYREKGSSTLRLSIGAPSSPLLSNILMYQFDLDISEKIAKDRVTYTRYADDLTFSAARTGYLTVVDGALREVIRKAHWPRLEINEKKTVLATTKYRRQVTGLVLPNDGGISLGRDRKRVIRAAMHHAQNGLLSPEELSQLCGTLAYVHAVEPEFLDRLTLKYGAGLISSIKKHANVSRRKNPKIRQRGPRPLLK